MDKRIRILIADNNMNSVKFIERILQKNQEYEIVGKAKDGYQTLKTCQELKPDIVLMNMNLKEPDVFHLAEKVFKEVPDTGIIFVGTIESAEIIEKSIAVGVSDFIEPPYHKDKFFSAISSLYELKAALKLELKQNEGDQKRRTKVIAIFSSKGGVGKSVIASNFAVALKKKTGRRVLLMDLDLQFGDIADMLNIDPKVGIIELINDSDIIDSSELLKYTIPHNSGISILAAPKLPEQADLISERHIKELMNLFLKEFDYIVIDLPPLFNSQSIAAIELSTELFLVCTPEVPTLKNVKGSLDILYKIDFPKEKIHLVVNKYVSGEIGLEDIKKFLHLDNAFAVEDNPRGIKTTINLGVPMVIKSPTSTISKQIFILVDEVIEKSKQEGKQEQNSIKKLFNKGG